MFEITPLWATLILIASALSFVAAQPNHFYDSSSCDDNEFWYEGKSCCLPLGGPPSPPKPPPEKQCPTTDWSWSEERSCCVPDYPPPPSPSPPRCPKNWQWSPASYCCQQSPHSPHYPTPSSSGYLKCAPHKSRSLHLCPMGLNACPIIGASGLTDDLECLDITHELESCGGCASIGQGQDCTSIKGAWNVGCEQGSCAVYMRLASGDPKTARPAPKFEFKILNFFSFISFLFRTEHSDDCLPFPLSLFINWTL